MLSMEERLKKRNEILGDNTDEEYVNVDSSSTSSFDITAISPPFDFSDTENNPNSFIPFNMNTTSQPRPPPLPNINIPSPPRHPSLPNMNITTPRRPPSLPIINPSIEQPVFTFDSNLIQRRINSSPNLECGNVSTHNNPVFDGVYSRRSRNSNKKLYLGILGGLTTVVSFIIINDYLLLTGKI